MIHFNQLRNPGSCVLFVAGVLLPFLLAGCAKSMVMSAEDLKKRKFSDIVVGSVLIKVKQSDQGGESRRDKEDDGTNEKGKTYRFIIDTAHTGIVKKRLSANYRIDVKAGEEKIFVTEMERRVYRIHSLILLDDDMRIQLPIHQYFTATRHTTYVGRLVITVPSQLNTDSPVQVHVEDAQKATIDAIRDEYGKYVSDVRKHLMSSSLMRAKIRGEDVMFDKRKGECFWQLRAVDTVGQAGSVLGYICGAPSNLELFVTTNDKKKAESLRKYWNELYRQPQLTVPIGGKWADGTIWDGEKVVSRDDPDFFYAIEVSFTEVPRFKFYPGFRIYLMNLYDDIY